jgi:TPR repeat protein
MSTTPDPKEKQMESATASHFYAAAAQRGHTLALHRLAHITSKGLGVVQSCTTAVNGFKAVAERADWSRKFTIARRLFENLRSADVHSVHTFHSLHTPGALSLQLPPQEKKDKDSATINHKHSLLNLFSETVLSVLGGEYAKKSGTGRNRLLSKQVGNARMQRKVALTLYAQLASMGYESAQANAAYILFTSFCPNWIHYSSLENITRPIFTTGMSRSDMNSRKMSSSGSLALYLPEESAWSDADGDNGLSCDARALLFYGLSAVQGNPNAYLRVGDFHYYGKAGMIQDKASAVKYYQLAANQRYPHATFNLGLMYEVGDGVVQVPKCVQKVENMASNPTENVE